MYKYPALGLVRGIESGIAVFPPLSLLPSCDLTSRHSTRRLLKPTRRISSHRSRDSYIYDFLIVRSLFRSRRTSLSMQHPQASRFHLRQIYPRLIDAARSHFENAASDLPYLISSLITELSSAGYHLRYTRGSPIHHLQLSRRTAYATPR